MENILGIIILIVAIGWTIYKMVLRRSDEEGHNPNLPQEIQDQKWMDRDNDCD